MSNGGLEQKTDSFVSFKKDGEVYVIYSFMGVESRNPQGNEECQKLGLNSETRFDALDVILQVIYEY